MSPLVRDLILRGGEAIQSPGSLKVDFRTGLNRC